jgi:hypothetical protein
MMKKFVGLQLALFFISAGVLYLYASNLFGAKISSPVKQKK